MKTRELQYRTNKKMNESESMTNDELTLKKIKILHPDQIDFTDSPENQTEL